MRRPRRSGVGVRLAAQHQECPGRSPGQGPARPRLRVMARAPARAWWVRMRGELAHTRRKPPLRPPLPPHRYRHQPLHRHRPPTSSWTPPRSRSSRPRCGCGARQRRRDDQRERLPQVLHLARGVPVLPLLAAAGVLPAPPAAREPALPPRPSSAQPLLERQPPPRAWSAVRRWPFRRWPVRSWPRRRSAAPRSPWRKLSVSRRAPPPRPMTRAVHRRERRRGVGGLGARMMSSRRS